MKPAITVITPVYNGAKYLGEAIDSVLDQSFTDFEYIIVDDCSSDSTPEILKRYALLDPRISVVKNDNNLGPLESRNNAIDRSKADYIAFIDADDIWDASKLKNQMTFMKKRSCSFSYTDFSIFTETKIATSHSVKCRDIYYLSSLFSDTGIALSSVVYRRDSDNLIRFANSGPYTEADLYLKLIALYGCGLRVPEELLKYRHHASSMSGDKLEMFRTVFHVYNQKLRFNGVISFLITFNIAFKSLSRQIKRYFL
ncbi:glycosyltransferase family 2 protein [Alphaproteobacteria bacterium]|nr:glycosyltransferase family 2 protein [Alphaproteobacteria bacterium]